jgi:hypothetical protein
VTIASAVATAVLALGLASDLDSSDFRYTRTLTAPSGAAVSFEPDGAMYAHARAGFPDLRVVDMDGTQVPWRTEPLPEAVSEEVALVARGRIGDVVSVVVDRGPAPKVIDRIELEIPDRDFVGDVDVLGSSTGAEGSYATLSTTQIYAVRGAVDARSTTALFPPTDYRYLLVRARGVSDVTGATVARDPRQPRLEPVAARSRVRERPRATVVRLDLGFADIPVDAIRVRSSTRRFARSVTVAGSNDGVTFIPIGGGEIARFRGVDLDRVPVDGRHRYVRVTVTNGDDAPLDTLRVSALARPRPLLLAGGHDPPFAVYYGARDVDAPAYDFARLPPAATGFEGAAAGTLGPETVNALFEPPADTRTFFERNRGALNALLVLAAIVVVVGGMLALRRRA